MILWMICKKAESLSLTITMLIRCRSLTFSSSFLLNVKHLIMCPFEKRAGRKINVVFCGQNIEPRTIQLRDMISHEFMPNLQTVTVATEPSGSLFIAISALSAYKYRTVELRISLANCNAWSHLANNTLALQKIASDNLKITSLRFLQCDHVCANDLQRFTDLRDLNIAGLGSFQDLKIDYLPPSVRNLKCKYDFLKSANDNAAEQTSLANVHFLVLLISGYAIPSQKAVGFRNLERLDVDLAWYGDYELVSHDDIGPVYEFIFQGIIAKNPNLTTLCINFPNPALLNPYVKCFTNLKHIRIKFPYSKSTSLTIVDEGLDFSFETLIENSSQLELLEIEHIGYVRFFSYPIIKALVLNESIPFLQGIRVSYNLCHTVDWDIEEATEHIWDGFDESSFSVSQFCGQIADGFPLSPLKTIYVYIDLKLLYQLCHLNDSQ